MTTAKPVASWLGRGCGHPLLTVYVDKAGWRLVVEPFETRPGAVHALGFPAGDPRLRRRKMGREYVLPHDVDSWPQGLTLDRSLVVGCRHGVARIGFVDVAEELRQVRASRKPRSPRRVALDLEWQGFTLAPKQ